MNILVTGASGFLGSHLSHQLATAGHQVYATGRNQKRLAQLKNCHPIPCDLTTADGLQKLITLCSQIPFDAIVNSAALCHSWGPLSTFMAINYQAALDLFHLAKKFQIPRFIHLSSPSIFATLSHQLDIPENTPFPKPLNHYAHSKQQAELDLQTLAESHPSSLTILRPQAIFGPGDPTLLPRLVEVNADRGIPLINQGTHLLDITPVETVTQAIRLSLNHPISPDPQIYNISNGEALTFRALVESLFDQIKIPIKWKPLPYPIARLAASLLEKKGHLFRSQKEPLLTRYSLSILAHSRTLSITKFQTELNFSPTLSVSKALSQLTHD
ncbi:MAG: nucleoside-diphosphate-sugar epimerase [Akkermansiaceae bacterium]|jgi:nucleoside-diphosphate-sugar epimerase